MSEPSGHDAGAGGAAAPGPEQQEVSRGLRRARRALRVVMGLVALAFVAYAAWDLRKSWGESHVELVLWPAAACFLPLALGTILLGWGWKLVVDRMVGRTIPFLPAVALHIESQAARYVPGKVGVPLVRMTGAPKLGVSAKLVGSSIAVEMLSFLAVGFGVGFALLGTTSRLTGGALELLGNWSLLLIALFAAAVLVLVVVDRARFPSKLLRALDLEGTGPLAPAALVPAQIGYWLTWAAHGYLVSRAVGVPHAPALASAGLYVLAPILGFLALAAPAGIGVREAVLGMGLAPYVGPAPALAAAVLSRAASLLVDVGMWGATRAAARG